MWRQHLSPPPATTHFHAFSACVRVKKTRVRIGVNLSECAAVNRTTLTYLMWKRSFLMGLFDLGREKVSEPFRVGAGPLCRTKQVPDRHRYVKYIYMPRRNPGRKTLLTYLKVSNCQWEMPWVIILIPVAWIYR
jgi:hypothetical protein